VYSAVAPELLSEDGRITAALLAAGAGALLSHATAAWRWRIIPAAASVMQLAVPRHRTAIEGLQLFVSGRLRAGDTTLNGRFPTTAVPRTLLDLATRYDQRALLRVLAEAEFHHDLRPADIQRTLRRGHPGSANLRAALRAHAPRHGHVKSRLERRFRALLLRRRIELPERNQALGPPGRSTASGPIAASWSSSTGAGTSARARPRRRPRPLATPPPLPRAPLRQTATRRAPRRRDRRPPRRPRPGRHARRHELAPNRRRPPHSLPRPSAHHQRSARPRAGHLRSPGRASRPSRREPSA
jgi:hypothetical protein